MPFEHVAMHRDPYECGVVPPDQDSACGAPAKYLFIMQAYSGGLKKKLITVSACAPCTIRLREQNSADDILKIQPLPPRESDASEPAAI